MHTRDHAPGDSTPDLARTCSLRDLERFDLIPRTRSRSASLIARIARKRAIRSCLVLPSCAMACCLSLIKLRTSGRQWFGEMAIRIVNQIAEGPLQRVQARMAVAV